MVEHERKDEFPGQPEQAEIVVLTDLIEHYLFARCQKRQVFDTPVDALGSSPDILKV
jgi:hypothetical protein